MRFKAELNALPTFTKLCLSLTKTSKKCLIKLKPEQIQFICAAEGASLGDLQIWATFEINTLFAFYHVESNANNEIFMEVANIEALYQALKSAEGASEVLMRLSKKGKIPFLGVHITSASISGVRREITQQVAVKVLKPSEMASYKEPLCPEPNVHIVLPNLNNMLTIATRMGKIGSNITIAANKNGQLYLRCETDQANIQTDYTGLKHPFFGDEEEQAQNANNQATQGDNVDERTFYKVNLAQKSLVKFLSSHVIANTTIASVCQNFCCIFYVYIGSSPAGGGVLTYFVPGIHVDGDELA